MMHLYFLRHGKAEAREVGAGDDAMRPLTDAGREETRHAARGLAALDLGIERILTSPALRAHETASLTAEALNLRIEEATELAPGCDLDGLARVLIEVAPAQRAILVGHEPDFSTLIGLLIGGRQGARIALKKGACCRVDLPTGDPRKLLGKGRLVWLLTPRQLGLMAPSNTPTPVETRQARPRTNSAISRKRTRPTTPSRRVRASGSQDGASSTNDLP